MVARIMCRSGDEISVRSLREESLVDDDSCAGSIESVRIDSDVR